MCDDLLQTIRQVLALLYGLNRLIYGDIDKQTMRTIATPKTGVNSSLEALGEVHRRKQSKVI
jgi:hypothetical protein